MRLPACQDALFLSLRGLPEQGHEFRNINVAMHIGIDDQHGANALHDFLRDGRSCPCRRAQAVSPRRSLRLVTHGDAYIFWRSEERLVGKEWCSTCRSRWSSYT